ncbi:MAG: hypothetical protein SGJ11_13550 [Phycisphaerae bacterium]|nr:hypothetical protein [Phycisphaerae bacterium]
MTTFTRIALVSLAALATSIVPSVAHAVRGPEICPCLGDLNADLTVDAADLAILLGEWGNKGPLADLNFDLLVDAADLAILLGAWGACPFVPVNDACFTPLTIGSFGTPVPFCTVNASNSFAAAATCDLPGQLQKDIFFIMTAPETGRYRAKVFDSTFDARAIVYLAPSIASVCNPPSGGATVLGCTDKQIPLSIVPDGLGRYFEFDLVEDQQIMVRVGSPSGTIGYGTVEVERCLPGNSPCEPLASWSAGGGGSTGIGTLEDSYPSNYPSLCMNLDGVQDEWHTFESACSQNFDLRISTCNGFTFVDTVLIAYVGSCGELFEIACSDDDCDDRGFGFRSHIVLKDCTPNTPYYVRLAQFPGTELGQIGLQFQVETICP